MIRGYGYEVQKERDGRGVRTVRPVRRGERYYRISGENVCRGCLADFAAQILAAYEVVGGEADA